MLAFTAAMAMVAGPSVGTGALPSLSNSFVANKGQWDERARFMARSNGTNLWVTDEGYVIDFSRVSEGRTQGHVVRVSLEGAGHAQVQGVGALPGKVNFYHGRTKAEGVGRFGEARTINAIPGVDARYYFDQGRPRYDLVVKPGANPADIKLNYEGAQNVRVGSDGVLRYETSLGTVEERGLYAFQNVNGRQVPVQAAVKVNEDGKVSFAVGNYDRTKSLVIDPIVWATYAGGTGNDGARKTAIDPSSGNIVVLGNTTSTDFPTTTGAYDTSANGNSDVTVSRYSADGTTLQFATYYGGTGNDTGTALLVTNAGNIVFGGTTNSTDIPRAAGQIVSGYKGGTDGFLSSIDVTGGTLRTGSYLGGTSDDSVGGIALDGGQIFVVGTTASSNFPIVGGDGGERTGIQRTKLAGTDAFFMKVNVNTGALAFSTFMGSSGNDTGVDVQPLGGGRAAVLGTTNGTNLLANWASKPGFQKTNGGGIDSWVVGVTSDGLSLDFRTYLGGSSDDVAVALTGDSSGFVAVGNTTSSNFPVGNGYNSTYRGPSAYVTKFDLTGGTTQYSFFYGTQRAGLGSAFANDVDLDVTGGPVLVGTTDSPYLGYVGNGAIIRNKGAMDTYIARFSAIGKQRWYATYLGGAGDDTAAGVAVDTAGNAYVVSTTASADFPITGTVPQGTASTFTEGTLTKFSMPVSALSFEAKDTLDAPYKQRFTLVLDGAVYSSTNVALAQNGASALDLPSSVSISRGARQILFYATIPALFQDLPFDVTATFQGNSFNVAGVIPAPDITTPDAGLTAVPGGTVVNGSVGLVTPSTTLRTPIALRLVDGSGNVLGADYGIFGTTQVQPNQTMTTFKLTTKPVLMDTTVYIEGAKGVKSAALTLLAARPSTVTMSRDVVFGPANNTATLRLTGKAPAGGLTVDLVSDSATATVPSTVNVPEGATTVSIPVTVLQPSADTVVTITATVNGGSASGMFTNKVR